ncbi:MAG: N-acetylmuramoyl-L-alanine amidase [Clostridia bacterium]|nr:N-acetylmuramoyl-L-alanine amidase [Oscillospiraceae bacterium]MBQ7032734.1 N-acetylmuramoyl-L-alanine amidase [Clostridia bacterium]
MLIILKRGGILFLALLVIVAFLVYSLLPPKAEPASTAAGGIIVIDPGHGAPDGGAVGDVTGILEKDLNLAISKKLAEKLTAGGEEIQMTREEDRALYTNENASLRAKKQEDMKARVSIANASGTACLISIHMNHFSDARYSGPQIFYPSGSEESQKLADTIRLSILKTIGPHCTRETKPTSDLYLLRKAEVPAVIVECGFLSNPEEESLLTSEAYQDALASAICSGVKKFLYPV